MCEPISVSFSLNIILKYLTHVNPLSTANTVVNLFGAWQLTDIYAVGVLAHLFDLRG